MPSPCMMAVTPSVAVSQYIDIYIVFPLGCSQGPEVAGLQGTVAARGMKVVGVGVDP